MKYSLVKFQVTVVGLFAKYVNPITFQSAFPTQNQPRIITDGHLKKSAAMK